MALKIGWFYNKVRNMNICIICVYDESRKFEMNRCPS